MSLFWGTLVLLGGILLVIMSSWVFMRGVESLCVHLGVKMSVWGVFFLALGGCLPEIALCTHAAFQRLSVMALAGIIGSSALNLLFIVGMAGSIVGVPVAHWKRLRANVFFILFLLGFIYVLGLEWNMDSWSHGMLTPTTGLLLIALLFIFLYLQYRYRSQCAVSSHNVEKDTSASTHGEGQDVYPPQPFSWWITIGLLLGGLGMLYISSRWAIRGARVYMYHFNLAQEIMGLLPIALIVALPELFMFLYTLYHEGRQGMRGLLDTVVISSNLNFMLALGGASLIAALPFYYGIAMDFLVLGLGVVLLIITLYAGKGEKQVSRGEGILLLIFYALFFSWIVLRSHTLVRVVF